MKVSGQCMCLIFILFLFFSCYKQGKRDGAKNYADTLISMQEETVTQTDSFFQSLYFYHYDVNGYHQKALFLNRENMQKLQHMGSYGKRGDGLYHSSKDFYSAVDTVLQNEGLQLMKIYSRMQGDFNSSLKNELDSILKNAIGKITEKRIEFDSVLTIFLEYYGYELEIEYEGNNTRE